jgi:hypothetical protein
MTSYQRCIGVFVAACGLLPGIGMAQPPGMVEAAHRVPSPPQCPSRMIVAGVIDGLSPAAGVEAASPSPALTSALAGVTFADFESLVPNRGVAHTFQLPRCGAIVEATLVLRAKPLPANPSSDGLTLGFSTLPGFPRWAAWFGGGNAPAAPSLQRAVWGSTAVAKTFTLDLAALPAVGSTTISLLSAIQTQRYLDFYAGDDTSIDYVKLIYKLCGEAPCGTVAQGEANDSR